MSGLGIVRAVTALAAAGVLTAGLGTVSARAGGAADDGPRGGTVTVVGEGTAAAMPDLVRLELDLRSRAKTLPAAVDEVALGTRRIRAALAAEGVAARDILAPDLRMQRDYYAPADRPRFLASQSLSIALRDREASDRMTRVALVAGGPDVSIDEVTYEVTRRAKILREARARAFADARAKAVAYAEAAGRSVGSPLAIVENVPPGSGFAHFLCCAVSTSSAGFAEASTTRIPPEPGPRRLRVKTTVVWALGESPGSPIALTVGGLGIALGAPGAVRGVLDVAHEAPKAADAQRAVEAAVDRMRTALADYGVRRRDVDVLVFPVQRGSSRKVYVATHRLTVTLHDPLQAARAYAAAVRAGGSDASTMLFEYRVAKGKALRAAARLEAIAYAQEIAEQYARLVGRPLGAVGTVTDAKRQQAPGSYWGAAGFPVKALPGGRTPPPGTQQVMFRTDMVWELPG